MSRRAIVTVGAAAGLAVLVQLASYFLRLGLFWPAPWLIGGGVLVILVRQMPTDSVTELGALLALTLATYAAAVAATERWWFGRTERGTVAMTWEERPAENGDEAEVLLRFTGRPSHFVVLRSAELVRHLRHLGSDTVPVVFRLTRDLGCLRGASVRRIGDFEVVGSVPSYAGREGPGRDASPWGEGPPWCR